MINGKKDWWSGILIRKRVGPGAEWEGQPVQRSLPEAVISGVVDGGIPNLGFNCG